MSDQFNSGSSDRSGATPWNSPDPSTPAGNTGSGSDQFNSGNQSYGSGNTFDSTAGQSAGAPSYSQPTYPQSAYSQPAGAGQYGAVGNPDPYAAGSYGPKPQGMAIAALVFGILSILLGAPILGVILGLVAIVLGFIALKKVKKGVGGGRGLAIAGIVTGIIGALISIVLTVFLGAVLNGLFQSGSLEGAMECSQLPQAQQEACINNWIENMDQGTSDRT